MTRPRSQTDLAVKEGVAHDLVRTLDDHQQGDGIVGIDAVMVGGPDGWVEHPTPLGVAILSQTCDVVIPQRATVTVGKIVRLEGSEARQAADGRSPRYVPLPQLADHFADLEVVATIDKVTIRNAQRMHPMPSDPDPVRVFGRHVGRRYSRYPFPDEVVPWLRPLQNTVRSKYDNPSSPLGRALDDVEELRIQAESWDQAPYDLTLIVILLAGVLPEVGDDLPELPSELGSWLRDANDELLRTPGHIAGRLYPDDGVQPDVATRYYLWMALADAWAAQCRPSGTDALKPGVANAVAGGVLSADVADETDFPLSRMKKSEYLDVEHLSGPWPI